MLAEGGDTRAILAPRPVPDPIKDEAERQKALADGLNYRLANMQCPGGELRSESVCPPYAGPPGGLHAPRTRSALTGPRHPERAAALGR